MMLFLTVALVHLVALMAPGPDFFFVSQTAVSRSRSEAMQGVDYTGYRHLGSSCADGAPSAADENGMAA